MKVNQKKANKIMGLFATLNKIELDIAISKQDADMCSVPEYIKFDCIIKYSDYSECFDCELYSQRMVRESAFVVGRYRYRAALAFGGHWPTTQTLWDDVCSYTEFEYVVMFVRNAIRAGGLKNMKYVTHQVTVDMPDYLNFEELDL